MAGLAATSLQQLTAARPSISISFTHAIFNLVAPNLVAKSNESSWIKHASTYPHLSSVRRFHPNSKSFATKANNQVTENKPASVLPIDLRGQILSSLALYISLPFVLLSLV